MSTPLLIIEDGLFQYMVAQTAITSLTTTTGIYLNSVPENAHDACIGIQKISSQPDTTNDGPSGVNFRRYQVSCYSKSVVKALQLARIVQSVLDGFVGYFPNGQRVYNIIRDNELDGFDDLTGTHRQITDYIIHFAE